MDGAWKEAKLSAFADVKYGKATPRDSGSIPVVGSGGVFGATSVPLVEFPTLVIGRKGTAGKVWFLKEPSWPSDTTFYLEWKSADVDPSFLYYALQARPLSGEHARTTMPSLQRQDLEEYDLSVPPLREQRAIAHVLETVQKAKEVRQRELVLERERKAALMERLFTHGTRGEKTKETEVGNIPESWSVLPMATVAKIERGKFAQRPRNDPTYYGGTTPFVQTGDVTASDGHITKYSQTLNERGLSVSKIFPRGTILLTIAANIGFSAILEFASAFPDSLIGITPNECIDAEFLNYYLMTQQPEMDRKAPRGTQKNINIEFLAPWKVPVPPLDEQLRIASALRASDRKSKGLRQETALLTELFDVMLKDLMTGRISASALVEKAQ